MKTELFTVSKIFNEALFRIPDYQRGYSWTRKQLKDFWSDIEQIADEKNHYTGVITLEEVPERIWDKWDDDSWIIRSRKYCPYYVVDGQQRLTTIAILIQCILESSKDDDLNYTSRDSIVKKYIFENRKDALARAYIFGYEKDNPSYEYLKKEIFGESSEAHSSNEVTIYTRNLQKAKQFFLEKMSAMDQSAIEAVFTSVTQQLVFNVYEISKDIDVFIAFETMNNRGKPLSTLELLKNRLIYLVMHCQEEERGDRKRLRRTINDAWKTVYHNLGKNEDRPLDDDRFLQTHLAYFYLKNIAENISQEDEFSPQFLSASRKILDNTDSFLLNQLFTKKNLDSQPGGLPQITPFFLKQYSADIKKSVETYFNISTPKSSNLPKNEVVHLERIWRLSDFGPSATLLAVYMDERDSKKRERFVQSYERFIFILTMIAGARGTYSLRYQQDEVVKYIKGKHSVDDLATYYDNCLSSLLKERSIQDILNDWTKNGVGYYGWKGIKYFLYEYELSLLDESKTEREKLNWASFSEENFNSDYTTVEHIYPQKAHAQYWSERFKTLSQPQRTALRHSLGNLLALSKAKNSSLGNKPFPEKVEGQTGMTGYRYGSYSEIEVSKQTNWGPQEIIDRGVKMLDFLEKRWLLPIGDRDKKIVALGLKSFSNIIKL